MKALLDLQIATDEVPVPSMQAIQAWLDATLEEFDGDEMEVTVRLVDEEESRQLNHQYRGKDYPTNVLSFPHESPPGVDLPLLGDLVICAKVVCDEAAEQEKAVEHHWAHMVVHGTLHLMGYDHIDEDQANIMESLEIDILGKLSIDDPYQDH